MKEAGEILLALRQAPPALAPKGFSSAENGKPAVACPPLLAHARAAGFAAAGLRQGVPVLYGYQPIMAYIPQATGVKRAWTEQDQKAFVANGGFFPSTMPVMASMLFPHPVRSYPFGQQAATVAAATAAARQLSMAREAETIVGRTHTTVHRYLSSELSKTLEDKVGYGSITPFRPTDKEYSIVFEGVRTMFFSKNKKSSWRTMYRSFLDYIGVKTRKFPPSWWCVSNKDITSEQREKCMRLLLTIGVETLALLDEYGHSALRFQRDVDPEQLGSVGLRVREDPQYMGFWRDEWKTLPSDVQFESAASIWYLATLNRHLAFLGDGVLKFMTFLMVRRCDFFRVHTGKHAQGKVPKRYIMNSNSMSNSYARLMSIQLLDQAVPTTYPAEVSSSTSSVSAPSSPDYTSHSPPSSPCPDDMPEFKRARVDD